MNAPHRKICISIQTYSDNREILFRFHDVDKELIDFFNSFDKVFFSFHNCSEAYQTRMLQHSFFKELKNVEIITYTSIPYPQTFLKTLLQCWREGFEYLLFFQDDVFTYRPGNLSELAHILKTADYNFLSLETNHEDLHLGQDRTISKYGDTIMYKATSKDYSARGMYACDDGAYAGALEFLMGKVYSHGYFQCKNICDAENFMNDFVTNNPIERYCTNYRSFKRYNIVGQNTWNKYNDIRELNTRFYTSYSLTNT